jgi:hypothetical protein
LNVMKMSLGGEFSDSLVGLKSGFAGSRKRPAN